MMVGDKSSSTARRTARMINGDITVGFTVEITVIIMHAPARFLLFCSNFCTTIRPVLRIDLSKFDVGSSGVRISTSTTLHSFICYSETERNIVSKLSLGTIVYFWREIICTC